MEICQTLNAGLGVATYDRRRDGPRIYCCDENRATYKLVLLPGDVGDIHVVGGGRQIFKLLASEDVNGNKMDLGVTVLARLGGGHVDDLARTTLDHDVTVLTQSRALHGVGGRGTGIGGVELELVLWESIVSQQPDGYGTTGPICSTNPTSKPSIE